jgi:ligand-binding SRPBCC domain-containing protein
VRLIVVETLIHAPREVVFDLSRDVDAHMRSASFSRERAIPPGRTSGLLEAGDSVTFEGKHFGIRQSFTVHITEMERPMRYVDEATHRAFRRLRHVHEFEEVSGGTWMRDTLEFESRFGILAGWFLRRFVTRKQNALKKMCEASTLHFEISGDRR